MSSFIAKWFRAKNINRWALQTNLTHNDDATHSFECSIVAHMIGTIDQLKYGNTEVNPDYMASLCIYHEAGELGLGDINSVAKNIDPQTKAAIKRIEHIFEKKLLDDLPEFLREAYEPLITQEKDSYQARLCKAADDICAFVEVAKEFRMGNFEAEDSLPKCKVKVDNWRSEYPCVEYFCETFLEDINLSVDKHFGKANS